LIVLECSNEAKRNYHSPIVIDEEPVVNIKPQGQQPTKLSFVVKCPVSYRAVVVIDLILSDEVD
jgi:hypothetical protein